MKESWILRALLVLGIAANVALLFINLRPDRPHLVKRRRAAVLIKAESPAAGWIAQNELTEFGDAHDVSIEVRTASSYDEIIADLAKEAAAPTGLLLATVDDSHSDDVRAAGTVRPFDGAAPPEGLAELADFLDDAARFCRTPDGKTWFWPRRGEMTVAVYLKPAVEDAYLHWQSDRAAIDAALKTANGFGLPMGYRLEKEPDDWDSYDLFVAAWYWAHHPANWADPLHPGSPLTEPSPRLAWRTGKNDDAVYDLLGTFYRHGMTDAQMGQTDLSAIADALQWEALMRRYALLLPETGGELTEDALNDLFKAGRLAWAPMDQEDSFWLHGGARRDSTAGMVRSDRLNWAVMPVGASLELNHGSPARVGRSYAFQMYELWAMPRLSPDPPLAFELVHFLTAHGLTQRETEALGMMPVRKDIRDNYPVLFRLGWMQSILDASYRQLGKGAGQMPDVVADQHLGPRYAALRAAVLSRNPITIDEVRASLKGASDAH